MSTRARIAFAVACLLLPSLAHAAPVYSLTPIDASGPADSIYPRSINDRGEVAGTIGKDAPGGSEITYRPFFWNDTGPARELAVPAGTDESVFTYAINNRGEVLGKVGNNSVIWSRDGTVRTVAAPAGYTLGPGTPGLNDAGTIFTSASPNPNGSGLSGFRRHADGSVDELPGLVPVALNQLGTALGQDADGPKVWERDGTVRALATTGYGSGHGYAINDAGSVAGMVLLGDIANLAVWRPDGTFTVAAVGASEANGASGEGINNRGEVVGFASGHAVYWSEADGLVDLQTRLDASGAGWSLTSARGINDAGQIIATASRSGSTQVYGVLLTPVPEPSTALAGAVVLALVATRRRWGRH